VSDTTAPAKPSGLSLTDKTDTTASLTWNALENNVPLDGEIYNAETDTKVASVMSSNTATVTGLNPDTSYSFYVVAKDFSGNSSPKSDPVSVMTTIAAIIVDNTVASVSGNWTVATGNSSNNNNYLTVAKGTGAKSVTWMPNLPRDGYYNVYYLLPNGTGSRATDAPFTLSFDGGSKTYAVNERPTGGGVWVPLGIHPFKAGTTGYVKVTDNANGEVAADAVKFQYLDGFGPASIDRVSLTTDKLQLRLGATMGLSVYGVDDASGKSLDLASAGSSIQYHSDNAAVSVSDTGVITAVSQGTANIQAIVTINGTTLTSNTAQVIAGPGFSVQSPAITDIAGHTLASLSPYGIVQAKTTAINSTEKQQNVTLIIAVYNQKGLIKSSTENAVIKNYDHATLNATLVLPADVSGCYVKVFVWDGKDALHPLTARTVYMN
jgi:hypothetical protein